MDQRLTAIDGVRQMLDIAVQLRQAGDPLLAGQIDGVIGRLTALLAVLGEVLPDDLLNAADHRERA